MSEKTIEIALPAATSADPAPAAPVEAAEAPQAVEATAEPGDKFAALQAELEELRAGKAAAESEAEAARVLGLSDAERLTEEREAWRQEDEGERTKLRIDLRAAALDRAGVMPKYADFVPDVDVRTAEGQKALEGWINDHPETVKRGDMIAQPSPTDALIRKSSKLADILTGKRKSSLVTQKSIAEMFNNN